MTIAYGRSDIGVVRDVNQDALFVDAELGLFIICDGMGGHAAGEVASELACRTIARHVGEIRDTFSSMPLQLRERALAGGVLAASEAVHLAAKENGEHAGMGCTATAVLVVGQDTTIAHVGDCRVYLVSGDEVEVLTTDHTLASDLARRGLISAQEVAHHHQAHVLTRSVGTHAAVEVETHTVPTRPGDRLLLMSDGVSHYVPSEEWLVEIAGSSPLSEVPARLIAFANQAGGRDNATVIAVEIDIDDEHLAEPALHRHVAVLGASVLFRGLSLADLSYIAAHCEIRDVPPGAAVTDAEGQQELIVVLRGFISSASPPVTLTAGASVGLDVLGPPTNTRPHFTSDGATVAVLTAPKLLAMVRRRPQLGVTVLTRLVEKLSAAGVHAGHLG